MNQTLRQRALAEVRSEGTGQVVLLPKDFTFANDHVYLERNAETGVVTISEKPLQKWSLQEIFDEFDAIGATDFEVERDRSLPRDIEL